jgi:peroxiredoxin family protein
MTPPPLPAREDGLDRLSLLVFSGDFERVHYALVLASAAAAIGKPATLFFAGPALAALRRDDGEGRPGWHRLAGTGDRTASTLDAAFDKAGIATFEALLEACAELGVRVIACEMALKAAGLTAADLRPNLKIEIAGAVTLLAEASPLGALVSI